MIQNALMLIDVAYLGTNDNDSLVFFDGNKHGIWPSMYDPFRSLKFNCNCIKVHIV
jgi:hypothetical protein